MPVRSDILFTWVEGHVNSTGNERAGETAKEAAEFVPPTIFQMPYNIFVPSMAKLSGIKGPWVSDSSRAHHVPNWTPNPDPNDWRSDRVLHLIYCLVRCSVMEIVLSLRCTNEPSIAHESKSYEESKSSP